MHQHTSYLSVKSSVLQTEQNGEVADASKKQKQRDEAKNAKYDRVSR